MKFRSKNLLVTGGSGFIGSHVVDKLKDEGHNVTVLDVLKPHRQDVNHVELNINDLNNVLSNLYKTLNRDEVYLEYWENLLLTQEQETADSLIKSLFYYKCPIYCGLTCKTDAEFSQRAHQDYLNSEWERRKQQRELFTKEKYSISDSDSSFGDVEEA